jgi:hypothetical protein
LTAVFSPVAAAAQGVPAVRSQILMKACGDAIRVQQAQRDIALQLIRFEEGTMSKRCCKLHVSHGYLLKGVLKVEILRATCVVSSSEVIFGANTAR